MEEGANLDLNVDPFPQTLLELALGAAQHPPPRSLLPSPRQNFPLFDPGMSDSFASDRQPELDADALEVSPHDEMVRPAASTSPIVVSLDHLSRGVRSISSNSNYGHLSAPPSIHGVPAFADTTLTGIAVDSHHDGGTRMFSGLQIPCLGNNATVRRVHDNHTQVPSIRRCFLDHLDVPQGILSTHLLQNGTGDPESSSDYFVRQSESESAFRHSYVSAECSSPGTPLQQSTADLALRNANLPSRSNRLFNVQSGNECDQTSSQRSPRFSVSPLHWRRARRRMSSAFSRARSQASMPTNGAMAHLGMENISGISRNTETRNAEARAICLGVRSCEDVNSIPEQNNNKDDANGIDGGSLGTEFECNICLEMASEPVVTCCGHLFCWPCLYQWLHVHSVSKMCPVCKGFLSDSAIIPIYGRGVTQDSGMSHHNMPARPHAHRVSRRKFHWEPAVHNDISGPGAATEVISDNSTGARHNASDDSNATNLILERLRVAQRLQQEYFERRSGRLTQRLMARRGEGRRTSLSNNNETITAINSSEPRELRRARHTLETAADDLAAIQASIDGLRTNMQRLVEFVSRHSSALLQERQMRNVTSNLVDPEIAFPLRTSLQATSPISGLDTQILSRSTELQESNRTAANNDFGSCEAEANLLHAHKRHRFN